MINNSHTVNEDLRIRFTKQLNRLREEDVKEVVFPATLTNIERKFLHTLAEELGLKSKSKGKGEDRCITVTKIVKKNVIEEETVELNESIPFFSLNSKTTDLLSQHFDISLASSKSKSSNTTNKPNLPINNNNRSNISKLSDDLNAITKSYEKAQFNRKNSSNYVFLQKSRESLPAFTHKNDVCELIKKHQIILVSGETGCGKSTQVPQFLLDDADIGSTCRIAITQPRRLSAMSVSERIASERGEPIGTTVGYNIRLESEKSKNTQLLFVTPGVLLRKLQTDALLEEYSHIIIDEAHERDRFTEFLLIIVREICLKRPLLKVILMSATMQTKKLSSYFGNVPHISMGGSVFPVQEFYLEHILRFTDFLKDDKGLNSSNSPIAADALSALILNQSFVCSICQQGQFKTPEELGQHIAMCAISPPLTSINNVKSYSKKNISSNINSLADLVRTLTLSAESGQSNKADDIVYSIDDFVDLDEDMDNEIDDEDHDDNNNDSDEDPEAVVALSSSSNIGEKEIDEEQLSSQVLLSKYHQNFDDSTVDFDLIIELLLYSFSSSFGKNGSTLVFLSGWDDISKLYRLLLTHQVFGNTNKFRILQLHSGIPKKEQSEVFQMFKDGYGNEIQKIILSTNIAETSVTINDITVVIDTGRVKEKTYDPFVKLQSLKASWISQASARQRKGRAGRTRAGVCFHLYSKKRHESLLEFQDSELLRMPLEELVLQAKKLNLCPGKGEENDSIQAFLEKALDPPHIKSISNAIQLLQSINCLDNDENLTDIGEAISKLPMDPKMGRLIILGCLLGFGPSVVIHTAACGYRDPFIMPTSDQQRIVLNKIKQKFSNGYPSDQISLMKALEGFNNLKNMNNISRSNQYCDNNFLSRSTMNYMNDLVSQLDSTLHEIGIQYDLPFTSRNNSKLSVFMSIIGIGLYPDIGVRYEGQSVYTTEKGRKAKLHPSSNNNKNHLGGKKERCNEKIEIIGYQDLISTSGVGSSYGVNLQMLNTTQIGVFSLILFSGSIIEINSGNTSLVETSNKYRQNENISVVNKSEMNHQDVADSIVTIIVDDFIQFSINRSTLSLVYIAREKLLQSLIVYVDSSSSFQSLPLAKDIDIIIQALNLEQQNIKISHCYTNHSDNISGV